MIKFARLIEIEEKKKKKKKNEQQMEMPNRLRRC